MTWSRVSLYEDLKIMALWLVKPCSLVPRFQRNDILLRNTGILNITKEICIEILSVFGQCIVLIFE